MKPGNLQAFFQLEKVPIPTGHHDLKDKRRLDCQLNPLLLSEEGFLIPALKYLLFRLPISRSACFSRLFGDLFRKGILENCQSMQRSGSYD